MDTHAGQGYLTGHTRERIQWGGMRQGGRQSRGGTGDSNVSAGARASDRGRTTMTSGIKEMRGAWKVSAMKAMAKKVMPRPPMPATRDGLHHTAAAAKTHTAKHSRGDGRCRGAIDAPRHPYALWQGVEKRPREGRGDELHDAYKEARHDTRLPRAHITSHQMVDDACRYQRVCGKDEGQEGEVDTTSIPALLTLYALEASLVASNTGPIISMLCV